MLTQNINIPKLENLLTALEKITLSWFKNKVYTNNIKINQTFKLRKTTNTRTSRKSYRYYNILLFFNLYILK